MTPAYTEPDDRTLRRLLAKPARFACVGVSPEPIRPSHFVARHLAARGYEVVAINPRIAGQRFFGSEAVATLAELAEPPDILDIFRRPEAVPAIVEEGLRRFPAMRAVWLQIGIRSAEAVAMCAEAGVTLIQDRCPKIEHQRLFGELRMGGFATGVLSSRLPRD